MIMKKYTFYVSGTSCNSCKMFIEEEISKIPGVSHARVDIHSGIATFEREEADVNQLLEMLNTSISGKRYVFSL